MTLRSGRRADLVALAGDGTITIVEIKSSIEDFRADAKWQDYCLHSDHFYFATGPHVPAEIFPPEAGLIVADPYGAEILRPSGLRAICRPRRARRCWCASRAPARTGCTTWRTRIACGDWLKSTIAAVGQWTFLARIAMSTPIKSTEVRLNGCLQG